MEHFDICVIGGGPSGYAAAMRAVDFGKKTVLIEKHMLGGAGVFNGALSSKTLWELSENYAASKHNNLGFTVVEANFSFKSVCAEMQAAVSEKHQQLHQQIQTLAESGLLCYMNGTASFNSPTQIQITQQNASQTIEADKIILATGSTPRKLPHIPIDEKIILTSDGIGQLENFPESLVILGAGVIGCEFATIFSNFGKTKVNLIDKQNRILPFEDDDVATHVAANFEKNGVCIHKEAELVSMEVVDGKVHYCLQYPSGLQEKHIVEKALISVGRVPHTKDLNLDAAGVKIDTRGNILHNDSQTDTPNIYAVGDLTADIALVNVAELEGRHAVEKIMNPSRPELVYENISTIMFLNPEVAGVGFNEKQALQAQRAFRVACFQYNFVNRALAMRKKNGFFKLLVSDDEEMRILGMRVVGAHASSTIQAVALLIHMKKGVREITELVHAHPSMPEGIQECARMFLGSSIMKPLHNIKTLKCQRYDSHGNCQDWSPNQTEYALD